MEPVENIFFKGHNRLIGSLYIVVSAVLYGLMPLMTKTILAHGGNTYTTAFLCFAMGAVFLWPVLRFKTKETIRVRNSQLISVVGLSCFHAVTLVLLYSSYTFIGSGLATTLHFTYPASVILLELILFHLLPTKRELVSLILAIAGIILINSRSGEVNIMGMILAIFSGITYAFYISLYGHSSVKALSALVMSFWINAFAAVELCIFITISGNWQLPKDITGWCVTVILVLATGVFARVFFQKGLKTCGGVTASLLSTLEPITSLIIGCLVYREIMVLPSVIAVVCILCSVLVLLIHPSQK